MSISLIPTFADPFFSEVVNLEGTDFLLRFHYNQREDAMYMDIATPDGDDIVNGIKCLSTWPLLHKWADSRLPPGELIITPNTPDTGPARLGGLAPGGGWSLFYYSSDQLP